LLNVHYATGYGLLGRLSGYKPLCLSVWGTDVYDFPAKSPLHRWLLKGNLRFANTIASTSYSMARKTAETYSHPNIFITPFGIDEILFSPKPSERESDVLVLGTVKTLKFAYGIDTLIKAFAIAADKLNGIIRVTLEITGDGPELVDLQSLAVRLGVADNIIFHGAINHAQVPEMLNRLDVYVVLSRLESFGVAILEASACEKPVLVSDAEGPAEVVIDGVTGFIVPKNDPEIAAEKMVTLLKNSELRSRLGKAGRQHVMDHYTWDKALDIMIDTYKKTIEKSIC